MIIIFREGGGRGGDTLKLTNNFCLYPLPVLRRFWKDPLMNPNPPPPHFKHHSLQPPSPSTTPPKKILIMHNVIRMIMVLEEYKKVLSYERKRRTFLDVIEERSRASSMKMDLKSNRQRRRIAMQPYDKYKKLLTQTEEQPQPETTTVCVSSSTIVTSYRCE